MWDIDRVKPVDCLVLGHHEIDLRTEVTALAAMGKHSGSYRDIRLAYVEVDHQPYRALDLINHFRLEIGDTHRLHNCDFLWPAVAQLVTFLSRECLVADYVNLPHLERANLIEKLQRNPKVVAITTTLHVAPAPILDLLPIIRQHAPDALVVVGGPFIYNQSRSLSRPDFDELMTYLSADVYVVSRSGERALVEITRAICSGTTLEGVANIVYRPQRFERLVHASRKASAAARLRDWARASPARAAAMSEKLKVLADTRIKPSGLVYNEGPDEDHRLEETRIDYALFPKSRIGSFALVASSKSCPFACSFCGFPQRAGPYRYLAVEDLASELDQLQHLGVRCLSFIDDTLNVPKKRFKEMLEFMIERNYEFRWNCFYRADHGDAETIDLMRRAGCEAVFLGVESGSDRILHLMNKTARREHYLRAIPMLRDAGILTHANLIVGFPGETNESVGESIGLIERARPDTFRAQLWYCDPMTPIWQSRHEHHVRGQAFNWRHATMDCAEAADWVDKMFLEITDSVWLPQHGFEQWSIIYLAHHGMPREAIFSYMRHFNALIRERLNAGEDVNPNGERLSALRRLSWFDRTDLPALNASVEGSRRAAVAPLARGKES